MIQTDKNYVHGTAAEKLDYDVYSENVLLKDKKRQRANNKVKTKMVLSIALVFVMFFFVMYRYAVITELNYKLDSINKKYNDIKNDNTSLKVSIERELDLNKIRQTAESRLGMHTPDKYQIVFVKVQKHDYTSVGEGYKKSAEKNGHMLEAFADKLKGYFN